jgi:hypothetical protein
MSLVLLSIFGTLEEFIAGDLYPYRVPISIVAAILLAAATYGAYRVGVHRLLWRHRLASAVVGLPVIVLTVVVGNYLLSPLWERSFLEEAPPVVAATMPPETPSPSADGTPAAPSTPQPPPVVLAGEVMGADDFHFGRGRALIIETAPGQYVLRFEDFSVRNGPDLFVYVSPNPDGYDGLAVNLGGLKATDGAFNYDLPPGTDLTQVRSAIVWCRQFETLFAVATLAPPASPAAPAY